MGDLAEPLLTTNQEETQENYQETQQETEIAEPLPPETIEIPIQKKITGRKRKQLTPRQMLLMSKMDEITNSILSNAESTLGTPHSISCLSPSIDGVSIFFGSNNGSVSKYNTIEKKVTYDVPLGVEKIHSLLLDEINQRAFICGESSNIRWYRLPLFELEFEFLGHSEQVCQILLDSKRLFLYSASDDKTVRKWNLAKKSFEEIILQHNFPVKCIAMTYDGKYFFSSGEGRLIKVYDLAFNREILNLKSHNACVRCLVVNKDSSFLASGGDDNLVIIWDIQEFVPIKVISEHSDSISALAFNDDSSFLISGSRDSNIKVWDIATERREIALNAHTGPITSLLISNNQDFIASSSEDMSLKIWSFPTFRDDKLYRSLQNDILCVTFTPITKSIILCGSDKCVRLWNPYEDEGFLLLTAQGPCLKAAVSADERYVAIGDEIGYLYIVNLAIKSIEKQVHAHMGPIRDLCFTPDKLKIFTGGGDSKINIWNIETLESITLKGHQQSIWSISISSNGEILVSGSSDKTIRVWDQNGNEKSVILALDQVTCVAFDRTDSYIIAGCVSGQVKIWSVFEFYHESTFNKHSDAVTSLYITLDNEIFFSSSLDKTLRIYSLKYRTPLTYMERKQVIFCMGLSSDEKYIITGEHELIYLQENPLISSDFRILGPEDSIQKFLTYMKSLLTELEQTPDPEMDQFLVLPEFFNSLHIYAYYNQREYLALSLSQENPPIFTTKNGFNPLSVCLLRGLGNARDDVIRAFCEQGETNIYLLQMVESDLTAMNRMGFSLLGDLYNVIYKDVYRKGMPKFCAKNVVLPNIQLRDYFRVKAGDLIDIGKLRSHGIGITFFESYVKVNIVIGSRESIDFLESLEACSNSEVIKSQLVKDIINYKWQTVKYIMIYQGSIFLTYMLCLCIYTLFFMGNLSYLISLFIFNMLLLGYEVFQICVAGWSYFSDGMNYVDWSRGIFIFIYIIGEWTGGMDRYLYSIFSVATLMSWLRGLTYFRLLDSTRPYINLLFETAADISGFLILFLYSTLAFSFLFMVLAFNDSPIEIIMSLKDSYNLALGNYPDGDFNFIEFIMVTISLIIGPIIMFNLLISIISDTYERVLSDRVAADLKELINMIIEVEYMLFHKRLFNEKKYVQSCHETVNEDRDEWEGKLRALEKSIDKINQSNQILCDSAIKRIDDDVEIFDEYSNRLERILEFAKNSNTQLF